MDVYYGSGISEERGFNVIGAIAGDMIGAPYEKSQIKRKDFDILVSGLTDDTVLTVAVADAVLNCGDFAETIKRHAQKYHSLLYGGRFRKWM